MPHSAAAGIAIQHIKPSEPIEPDWSPVRTFGGYDNGDVGSGMITTLDHAAPDVSAIAISDGKV